MTEHFHKELVRLRQRVTELGGRVEENVRKGNQAVILGDEQLATEVIESDREIDDLEVEIEEDCLKVLALHQPVARDLRYIIAVLKMNNDMERIGDYAANISKRALLFQNEPGFSIPEDYKVMSGKVIDMLKDVLDALIEYDVDTARAVCRADDEVDDLNATIYDMIKEELTGGSEYVSSLIHLLTASRSLERIADHVTNIAEDIIYLMEGEIVRHHTAHVD